MRKSLQIAGLAIVYFATARLGLSLAAVHGIATTVWPPTGISIAALLLGGVGLWPGVLAGAIAANLSDAIPWWLAVVIGVGNTLEAVCGVYVLHRFSVERLERLREVLGLVLTAVLSPTVSATIGVSAATVAGVIPAADRGQAWFTWWLGDALGALIVAPMLLTWTGRKFREALARPGEAMACTVAMVIIGAAIFGGTPSVPPLAYVIFPFIVWSALRLGQAAVSATVLIAAALAISGTATGVGPFTAATVLQGLFHVQLFMAVVAITALTVGAVTSERRGAEAALESARAQLQLVTDTMSVPVTRCSRDYRYLWVSTPYADWMGLPPEQIVGRPIADVIGGEAFASIRPYIDRVLAGDPVEYEEAVNFRGPGVRWINAVYMPTFDAARSVDGWVAVVVDVTQRKQLEQHLREEGRLKDEFLAVLAHELRNPLAPIQNALELLRVLAPEAGGDARAREIIERQFGHIVRLVDDLLDASRVGQGKINLVEEEVDLAGVLAEAVETTRPLIDRQAQTLAVSLATAPLQIRGDRTRLVQIFTNLLQNAAKFTPRHGRLTLTSDYRDGRAIVGVCDTGVGLEPDAVERIFELFVQETTGQDRTRGGLGIGLTVVRRLVELHGGRVEARSAGPGKGSEFIVTLPATISVAASRQSAAPPPARRTLSVFVVEDNPDTADSFMLLLELRGHRVRCAADGLAAVAIDGDFVPDVAFVDIDLPGLDGYEVARRLRQRPAWRSTLFVALSGHGRDEDKRRSLEAGFEHHLVKPVDPRFIEALLAELNASRSAAAEATPDPPQ